MRRTLAGVISVCLGATGTVAQERSEPVQIRFAAVVGDAAAACGAKYDGVGSSRSTISIADFRFYLSRLRLVNADGSEAPVALTQDGLWQVDDVALLDFARLCR